MSRKTLLMVCVVFLGCTAGSATAGKDARPGDSRPVAATQPRTPTAETVLKTLNKVHPRLILTDERLAELKKLMAEDKLLKKCYDDVLKQADGYCERGPLVYDLRGPRLLHVSRECISRIYALGMAWRLTGEDKYARKAQEDLLAVCEFEDWNPSHFLDTCEMTHAVGVGYDWMFSYFDEKTRAKIKAGLIRNGLEPGIACYRRKPPGPTGELAAVRSHFNWNLVCNGGLLVGALAIAESDPKYAQEIVPMAVGLMPRALGTYAPDGAWPEGPGYWEYATNYAVYGLAALDTALGDDFGLSRMKGFSETGFFPVYITGPMGLVFNYADAGEKSRRLTTPCLFWLARKFNKPFLAEAERKMLSEYSASPRHFIWYAPAPKKAPPATLDRLFRGVVPFQGIEPVDVATFRSAWNDSNALFLAVKAGYNQAPHGHLDLGSFEIDALGIRWARDLGSDYYNLPGYWDRSEKGKRWTYYRMNSFSHNVPLLAGKDQDVLGTKTRITVFRTAPSEGLAVLDLTTAYKEYAKKVTRGVALVQDRRAILIQDEFEIAKPCELAWGMTTDAEIAVEKGRATLTLRGKKLVAHVLSPAGAQFSAESAEQKRPDNPNRGVSRLMIRLKEQKGDVRIAVFFAPVWPDGKQAAPPELKPLAKW